MLSKIHQSPALPVFLMQYHYKADFTSRDKKGGTWSPRDIHVLVAVCQSCIHPSCGSHFFFLDNDGVAARLVGLMPLFRGLSRRA